MHNIQYTVDISSELCKSLCTKLSPIGKLYDSEIVHYRQEGRRQGTIVLPLNTTQPRILLMSKNKKPGS